MDEKLLAMALRQRFISLNNALNTVETFAKDAMLPDDMKMFKAVATKLRNKYKV